MLFMFMHKEGEKNQHTNRKEPFLDSFVVTKFCTKVLLHDLIFDKTFGDVISLKKTENN